MIADLTGGNDVKKRFIHNDVKFFSQWESSDLVDDIINRRISAKDDPLWRRSGARTRKEYELWSWNACGMACLKMILSSRHCIDVPLINLCKNCEKYGGYIRRNDQIDGLYYHPFIEFINDKYGLRGRVLSPMRTEDIISEVAVGSFVIASVSHEIRNPVSMPSKRGGHLVLVVGYDKDNKVFFIHNPSGNTRINQEYAELNFQDFEKFFAHRGIVIL